MDNLKQKLLLEYLVSSSDTFAICEGIIEPEFFAPEFRHSVGFIKTYYDKYHTTPDTDQIQAETGVRLDIKEELQKDQIAYVSSEVETFCKHRAMERAVLGAPALIEAGDFAQVEQNVKDAILLSLQKDLGLRYYDNVEERLQRMLDEQPVHPLGWTDVDDALFGGISRKEMLLVAANSGGGKSITLSNIAFNFAQDGLNVLYISLELSEAVVAQRFDTMHTGISRRDWKSQISEIVTRVELAGEKNGIIDVKQLSSGTTANQIRAYLKEYYLHYGIYPDLLVVDYLDKMNPNEKIDLGNVSVKDKLCAEQLRDIFVDFNMYGATASQLNRSAVGATEHNHSQIAGGITKINETDVYFSIVMSDQMRAAGEIMFIFQKTRNSDGVGKVIHLKWNAITLRIENGDGTKSSLNFVSSNTGAGDKEDLVAQIVGRVPKTPSNSLLDLMGD